MANQYVSKPGQNTGARSPSGIVNAEHHDLSSAGKKISVVPGAIEQIVADSTIETPLKKKQMVRLANTTASVAFVWIGEAGLAPVAVDITNGLAIQPNETIIISSGELVNGKSCAIKTSANTVQAVLFEV